jgi:hypothetical protein
VAGHESAVGYNPSEEELTEERIGLDAMKFFHRLEAKAQEDSLNPDRADQSQLLREMLATSVQPQAIESDES